MYFRQKWSQIEDWDAGRNTEHIVVIRVEGFWGPRIIWEQGEDIIKLYNTLK